MADNWIKIRTDLYDDPDVYLMSDILSLECPTVVGHLCHFWSWMDRHTPDGSSLKLTESVIDKKIGVPGFSDALRKVGWLSGKNMDLELPKYGRHNGSSAKARALEAEAKRLRRAGKEGAISSPSQNVGQVSDKTGPKCPTREEKRREEKKEIKRERDPRTAPEKFFMFLDWQPSESFSVYMIKAGLGNNPVTDYELAEFCQYWTGEQKAHTCQQWENKLVASLKKSRAGGNGNVGSNTKRKLSTVDQARETGKQLLASLGVPDPDDPRAGFRGAVDGCQVIDGVAMAENVGTTGGYLE